MTNRLGVFAVRPLVAILVAAVFMLSLSGCVGAARSDRDAVPQTRIVLASTTSTQDSGLFEVLIPAFEEAYPEYRVEVVAKGTGEALALGESKDADVVLVHAKAKEEEFVARGLGVERIDVMYNDFIIVGPEADPAAVGSAAGATDAFIAIAAAEQPFISRGDESGTHTKELAIWKATGTEPAGEWYLSVGQGMSSVLKMAHELYGYTLTDRATFLAIRQAIPDLEVLLEGDAALFNQYGVIAVANAPNAEGATAFVDWITSDEGQAVIGDFGVEEYGQPLFVPNAPEQGEDG